MRDNKVYISLGKSAEHNKSYCLLLPSLISTVTTTSASKLVTPPSLKELCLRFIWNEKQKCKYEPSQYEGYKAYLDVTSDIVPSSLCDIINVGPVAYCDTPGCKLPIFTHVSTTVVTVNTSARVNLAAKVVPVVLYFCCDSCALQYAEVTQNMTDEYAVWLCSRLANACDIELV